MALASLLVKLLGLGAIVLVAQYVLAYMRSPLKNIPGPFLAKFSNLWRFFNHFTNSHIETQKALHYKHGDVVRLGPSTVSIADSSLIKTIYSTRGTYLKSDFYAINDALQNGNIIQNIFSTRSNEFHSRQVKPVQKLYSFQAAKDLEPLMNDTIRTWCSELEQRFMTGDNKNTVFDIADWISYFAWDFLGDMTFSKRLGFMEAGKDLGNMLESAESVMQYFSIVGQIPTLDKLLGKNPYCPIKFADFAVPAGFCVERFGERMQHLEEFKGKKDFMNGFLEAKREYPNLVGDQEVIGYLILNILGGADTTSIVLKAITYHILTTPRVHSLLARELQSAALPHPAPYSTLESLPYLDACIKEGLRMHPVAGQIFERVVPASGLRLANGVTLPPGTIVGCNPWIVHRDPRVFGDDAEVFRPERWLRGRGQGEEMESAGEYQARMRRYKEADMSFGNGNRVCLGRPLALVELYKGCAALFGRYKIELANPEKQWELHKQWFVWPHDIKVRMTPYEK